MKHSPHVEANSDGLDCDLGNEYAELDATNHWTQVTLGPASYITNFHFPCKSFSIMEVSSAKY